MSIVLKRGAVATATPTAPSPSSPGGAGEQPGAPVAPASSPTGSAPQASPPVNLPPLPAKLDRRRPIANILVVGESGTGKTESLKDLDWASGTVAFIDVECKGFAWQSRIPEDCYFPCESIADAIAVMAHVEANPKFTIGVVDSFTFFNLKQHEVFKKTHEGFAIYSALTSGTKALLTKCQSKRVRWIVTAQPEILTTESSGNTLGTVIKRTAVVGREMEGKVESYFSYAVYTKVVPQPNAKPKYLFALQSDGRSQGKIPDGVTDQIEMENSVGKLLKLIEKAEGK